MYGDIWLYANALPVGMSDWVFGIAKGDRGREMIAETVWFGAVGAPTRVLSYNLRAALRLNIVSEILPGGERIVAGQDVEILAGEAGSRYGRHGPVLPRFICVSIDLVLDMGFTLEKIALNE